MAAIKETVMTLEERLLYYQLFCHYYRGDLLQFGTKEWGSLVQILREYKLARINGEAEKAIQFFEEADDVDFQTFPYDYNRLFVGPNKLLASPYESSYRNVEGTVLQQETLKVRNFYHHAGLQVADEGQMPDDHIQFELELILHLLNEQANGDNGQLYKMFLESHLLQWAFEHCARIVKNSTNPITRAMAILLKEFLHLEKKMIEGED
ncbi:TorD/DmsD family molecular chaperone [Bacillus sp. FJAT-27245]|uniref:TorD/DmsD family molecular chaperone n=1 Tax=Bacillus sp. FJAT-27245 TaxID=1684144 RepID=UPI0006A7D2DF|nr:molecular chaperone TorD family protein [Bacillus sp. FJAT-27245]